MSRSGDQFLEMRENEENPIKKPTIYQPTSNVAITKKSISNQIEEIQTGIDEGLIDPVAMVAFSKYLAEYSKKLISVASEAAINELQKEGGKGNKKGMQLEVREGGAKYDFSGTKIWVELKMEEDVIKEDKKALEEQLKAIKKPTEQIVEDEVITLNPPIKTSTTTIFCTIPKE